MKKYVKHDKEDANSNILACCCMIFGFSSFQSWNASLWILLVLSLLSSLVKHGKMGIVLTSVSIDILREKKEN